MSRKQLPAARPARPNQSPAPAACEAVHILARRFAAMLAPELGAADLDAVADDVETAFERRRALIAELAGRRSQRAA